jgi:hypothetical protein
MEKDARIMKNMDNTQHMEIRKSDWLNYLKGSKTYGNLH